MVSLLPRRRRRAAPAAAVALALLAGACGSDGDGDGAAATAGPAATAGADRAASTTEASAATTSEPAADAGTTPSSTEAAPGSVAPPPTTTARPELGRVRAQLQRLAEFSDPVAVAVRPGDERVYVVERGGTIKVMSPAGEVAERPAANLTGRTAAGGERGLLGLAFSPDGTRAYVNYTDDDGHTNVDELAVDAAGNLDVATRRRLLFIEQPYGNHNGGHLTFGPDGLLYIGTGDGGSGGDPQGNGQKRSTLLGKFLRIDPAPSADGSAPYTIPAGNPFVGEAGTRPEIWSLGLRNPWGFAFDPANGDLWVADVGQDAWEEVNVARAAGTGGTAGRGVNFGWNAFEGTHPYDESTVAPGALMPIHEYPHGNGELEGCSVTGGVVYRGSAVAGLSGAYLFADYCVAGIRAIDATATVAAADDVRVVVADGPAVVGFGTDAAGEVLVVSINGGVYRLTQA